MRLLTDILNVFEEEECKSCPMEHSYLLPSHPSLECIDPESITGNYDDMMVSKWKFISCSLINYKNKMKELNNDIENNSKWISLHIEQLIDTIYSIKNSDPNDYYPNKTDYISLRFFLNWISIRKFDDIFKLFFTQTLPKCIDIALKMNQLFPTNKIEWKTLKCGNNNYSFVQQYISLSRKQILCLLIHMFFNTTWREKGVHKYWTNFDIYYQQNESNQCVFSYLWTLVCYLNHFTNPNNSIGDDDGVRFKRISMTDYHVKFDSIHKDFEHNHQLKIDILNQDMMNVVKEKSDHLYMIDFANKYVGFGRSGTQEEVIFGSHCEACIVMLIAPTPMNDNEVILIENVQTIAIFENKGQDLKFNKCIIDKDIKINIIASDASELDVIDKSNDNDIIIDLQEPYFGRDLLKAIVMIGAATCCNNDNDKNKIIRTGLWGCGAFRGNKYIKVLIQIIAAHHISNNINCLQICCDDDYVKDDQFRKELLRFIQQYDMDTDHRMGICKILECLITKKTSFKVNNNNVFDDLVSLL